MKSVLLATALCMSLLGHTQSSTVPVPLDTLMARYHRGVKDYALMPQLIQQLKAAKQPNVASEVALDYIDHYLATAPDSVFFTKTNLALFAGSGPHATTAGFKRFYQGADRVNQVMNNPGYAQGLIDRVIAADEIYPRLWKDSDPKQPLAENPDWKMISRAIRKKYKSSYADRTILNAQLVWYKMKKDWDQLVQLNVKKIDKYGLDTVGAQRLFTVNMFADVIFYHSDDSKILNKAISWMEAIMQHDSTAGTIDVYAALLYKVDRVQEAIRVQERAVLLEEAKKKKTNRPPDPSYRENLERMKKGEPAANLKNV